MTRTRAPRRTVGVVAAIGLASAAWLTTSTAADEPRTLDQAAQPAQDLGVSVNDAFNVTESELFAMDFFWTPGEPIAVTVPFGDAVYSLDLQVQSVRAPGYRVYTQAENGELVPVKSQPVNTYSGTVAGDPDATVTASVLDGGLVARVRTTEVDFWIERVGDRVPGLAPDAYVAYAADAIISPEGTCGTEHDVLTLPGEELPQDGGGGEDGDGPIGGDPTTGSAIFVTELGCDADYEYFLDYGSVGGVENRINAIINTVNQQYISEVNIRHEISGIIVRNNPNDPYTSSQSGTLLSQFRSEWLNNVNIPRDVAKLFTGRELAGSVIGQAWTIGGICTTSGYCHSQSDCCGSFGCATDLCAHELGHLWNAVHCSCPNNTMNPTIGCANNFNDSQTIPDIIFHRDSRTCLDFEGTGPDNNFCFNASPVTSGSTSFTTVGATTDGPTVSGDCDNAGDDQIQSDVWYTFEANCSGEVTVDLCLSSFDTKLAVYSQSCPGATTQPLVCNDDFDCDGDGNVNDDGFVSRVTFNTFAGFTYYIRIGGFNGAQGTGVMNISGPGFDCPPINDNCSSPFFLNGNGGTFAFSNVNATTDGFAESGDCAIDGDDQLASDVWFRIAPNCTGTLEVSTCDQIDFDSKIALYAGACPTGPNQAIACNDQTDCGNASRVETFVNAGDVIYIRIGGYQGDQGSGTVSVTCTPGAPPCPEDLTGDGSVDLNDLNAVLASFNIDDGGDVTGDGVTDLNDLNAVLSAFGTDCP